MGTQTTNYSFYLPTSGGDTDTWGEAPDVGGLPASLNGNFRLLDTVLKGISNIANAALPKAGGAITGAITPGAGGVIGGAAAGAAMPIHASIIQLRSAAGVVMGTWAADGTLTVPNINATSDRAYKRDIVPVDPFGCLSAVMAMVPCAFVWKDSGKEGRGLIAQDLELSSPELVRIAAKGDGEEPSRSIDLYGVIAYLIGSVQALKAQLDTR
jgi:hypothetical protein